MITDLLDHPNTKTSYDNIYNCDGYSNAFSNTVSIISLFKPWIAEFIKIRVVLFISNMSYRLIFTIALINACWLAVKGRLFIYLCIVIPHILVCYSICRKHRPNWFTLLSWWVSRKIFNSLHLHHCEKHKHSDKEKCTYKENNHFMTSDLFSCNMSVVPQDFARFWSTS